MDFRNLIFVTVTLILLATSSAQPPRHKATTGSLRLGAFKRWIQRVTSKATNPLSRSEINGLVNIFDKSGDGHLCDKELKDIRAFLRPFLDTVSCLIVIDVQNDFINGTLALKNAPAKQDGAEVVPVINRLLQQGKFDCVAYSQDWHPASHLSFVENVTKRKLARKSPITDPMKVKVGDEVIFDLPRFGEVKQRLWPAHCIQNTTGAEFHPDLQVVDNAIRIYKGIQSDVESYSAFGNQQYNDSTPLDKELKSRNVTHLYLAGLASDVCVGNTALDGLKLKYDVTVIEDATRGVVLQDIAKMKTDIESKHGHYKTSEEVIGRWDALMEKVRLLISKKDISNF